MPYPLSWLDAAPVLAAGPPVLPTRRGVVPAVPPEAPVTAVELVVAVVVAPSVEFCW